MTEARRQFASFYAVASEVKAALMDSLALARIAFLLTANEPRRGVDSLTRDGLERLGDSAERVFTSLREAVRVSPAFNAVEEPERRSIEEKLFEVGTEIEGGGTPSE